MPTNEIEKSSEESSSLSVRQQTASLAPAGATSSQPSGTEEPQLSEIQKLRAELALLRQETQRRNEREKRREWGLSPAGFLLLERIDCMHALFSEELQSGPFTPTLLDALFDEFVFSFAAADIMRKKVAFETSRQLYLEGQREWTAHIAAVAKRIRAINRHEDSLPGKRRSFGSHSSKPTGFTRPKKPASFYGQVPSWVTPGRDSIFSLTTLLFCCLTASFLLQLAIHLVTCQGLFRCIVITEEAIHPWLHIRFMGSMADAETRPNLRILPAEGEGKGLETARCSDRRETLRLHLPAFRGTFSPVRFPDNYRNSHSSLPKERLAWDGIPRRLPLHFSDGERGEGRSSQAHCFPRDLGYGLLTFEGVWPDSISGISRFGHRHKGEIAGRNRRQEEDYCGSSASGKKHRSRHEASVLRGKLNFVTRIAPWLASVSRDVFAKDPVVSREARATWLEMLDVGSFPMRSPSAALTIMTDASHEAYGIVVKEHASGETREWSVAIQAEENHITSLELRALL
ncbi:hypothetical protein ADUPG1_011710, partial [Aduncisulcus paluster]